tara:strand:+ start:355 stop:522 length:168 start_codon:yes stop_codon:yes gene_type:complete
LHTVTSTSRNLDILDIVEATSPQSLAMIATSPQSLAMIDDRGVSDENYSYFHCFF